MLQIEIREIREPDIAECVAMVPQIEPWVTLGATPAEMGPYFRRLLGREEAFVAVLDGQVVGFATISRGFLYGCYVRRLAVKEGFRSRGIGRRLMRFIESYTFARYPNLFLCVSASNTRAQKFYRELGYRVVGELTDFIMQGHSEILLRKSIAARVDFVPVV
jgi:ribosomal-protein-alanine N-acetyltransferase